MSCRRSFKYKPLQQQDAADDDEEQLPLAPPPAQRQQQQTAAAAAAGSLEADLDLAEAAAAAEQASAAARASAVAHKESLIAASQVGQGCKTLAGTWYAAALTCFVADSAAEFYHAVPAHHVIAGYFCTPLPAAYVATNLALVAVLQIVSLHQQLRECALRTW
jgi:predicted ATPase